MAERAGFRLPRYLVLIAVLVVASIIGAIGVLTSGSETVEPCESPDELATDPGIIQELEVFENRRAPDFALRDARDPDSLVQLTSFCGQPTVMLWVVEDCPACVDSLAALAAADVPEDLAVLVIGPAEEIDTLPAFVDATLPGATVVVDEDDEVALLYGLRQVPLAIVLNEDQIIEDILENPLRVSVDLPRALEEVSEE